MPGYTHLHVASSYSLRYGTASPAALATRAAELGMPALALTDRDGLYGAVKHAVACLDHQLGVILGADMALRRDGGNQEPGSARRAAGRHGAQDPGAQGHGAQDPGTVRTPQGPARLRTERLPRVTLLAAGGAGWGPLCRLVSAAHHAGERSAPVVTPSLVATHGGGLVVLLGPGSDVGRAIAARRPDLAAAALARWRECAEVAIEIVGHDGAGATFRAARMLRLAREAGVPAVLTNAVRYLDPADGTLAQVLDAARQLTSLRGRHTRPADGSAHLASGDDMARVAARVCGTAPGSGDATALLAATERLAQCCLLDPYYDLGIDGRFTPEIEGEPLAQLRARCEAGLDRRFPPGDPGRPAARTRLDAELAIITRTGLASYFLIVADVTRLITSRGIRCSIRGSGAGCLVNYLIGISGIDPIEHDLIMERFLSEHRRGLPDIDLDVESARRIEAYRAIFDAYSENRVACVSMMETYRARSAIRDVATALGLGEHEAGAIAKAFPHVRAAHITGALAELPELRASGLAIPQLARVFQLAQRLDGLPRHVAMHPCGVVLSDVHLLERTPVEPSIEGLPLSQFDKDDVEKAGMIKLDVLGVRMQSAMAYTLSEVERTTGERIDIDAIDHHDEPTFEMICSARTLGCFQIESPGQRELVGKLEPRDIGDLIVDISLFRPGPVNSDMVTPYLETRHHRRPASYPHADLIGPLLQTGGVVIFHEQVLRIFHIMTGCGLSYAELVRRALSEEEYRPEIEEWFRQKALDRGYDDAVVGRVWEILAAFGAFGFCKAHAAAFAIPTYQSSWLKRHYPAAFYAGVLTHDPGMYPKRILVGDARLHGVLVLPVDVNACGGDWRVEQVADLHAPGLRPGLREVRGISDAEVDRIVAGQPYTSLRDFWERARVSRPVTERLVLVGAFDTLYRSAWPTPTRRDLLARVGVLAGRSRPRHSQQRPSIRSVTTNHHKPGAGMTTTDGMWERASGKRAWAGGAGADAGRLGRAGGWAAGRAGADAGRPGGARGWADGEAERGQGLLEFEAGGDGFAELVPAGELRDLSPAERVAAELEILGIDLSQHVLSFYEKLIGELGVVRATALSGCQHGEWVLVAGVKVATQTPAVRSGQRIIFTTLDDATGPVDLAFFESVQERCAARVFGSWLLVVRGQVRRTGRSVSVNGAECWDLAALAEIWESGGTGAVRAAMAAGDVPGPGYAATAAKQEPAKQEPAKQEPGEPPALSKTVYPNGFALNRYAETGSPGSSLKDPPRLLWHASPGSSGG